MIEKNLDQSGPTACIKDQMEISEFSNPEVLEFYRTLPFNVHDDPQKNVNAIRSNNSVENYPCLVPLLSKDSRVLEVGCGAGWLSNCMAYYYDAHVTAIDFNERVVAYAQKVSDALGMNTRFLTTDLFKYSPATLYDIVVSLGVLHHTGNCEAAIRKVCREFVKPGGYFLLGLYHSYGRGPFLKHFENMRSAGASEEELFAEYRRLHSSVIDETHLKSWFRDQVLHPHETQHTLLEISEILESINMDIVSTSINKFEKISEIGPLFDQEKELENLSKARLESGVYFPGFFVVLARRASHG